MKKVLFLLSSAAVLFTACKKENGSSPEDGRSVVQFYLTDAPAIESFSEVNVAIQSLSYSTDDVSWTAIPMQPVTVDLLRFNNGTDTLLSNILLEKGIKVTQIRMELGSDNSVKLQDGTIVALDTPSGETSGLKINVQSTPELTSGYKVVIDFDAARSIVSRGNGTYGLKPVIRAYITANTSAIFGKLSPENLPTMVFTVTSAGDTIATVSDTLKMNFFSIGGLFSGMYELKAIDLTTGQEVVLDPNVDVTGGTDVDLGMITLLNVN